MEERENPFGGVQVKIRRSHPALTIVVVLLILFSLAAYFTLQWVQGNIRQATEDMRQEAAALEHENDVLEQKKEELGSVQSVEDIAQDELDLADPNAVLFGND